MLLRKSVIETIDCLRDELDLVDKFHVEPNSPMILCRLDYWLISNNLQDSVSVTNIIPAIKTDHFLGF